ncbi:glycosyltransferase [Synechococcus sp. BIOS-U3-1]|uniref:glycosyltransferase n=1 Tax=Synechococcus sp. BIOS-U3-1 TaxID=1400865 RepID=UPI001648DD4D|nr:glycosyltransferase [Synechococcus sp. BIOS-U3-1]
MQAPTFSVAIAVYNGSRYLIEQVNSINAAFNFASKQSSFELVCVDDKSTDNSVEILNDLATSMPLRIFCNSTNLGHNKTFEIALLKCRGSFIFFSDQDDIWPLTRVSHTQLVFNKFNPSMLCGNFTEFRNNSELSQFSRSSVKDEYLIQERFYEVLIAQLFSDKSRPYFGSTMLFSRDLLNIALPLPALIDEHDKWFSLCASTYKGGLLRTSSVITYRRIHSNNLTKNDRNYFLKLITRLIILIHSLILLKRKLLLY